MEDIGNLVSIFLFVFVSVQRSKVGNMAKCFLKPEQLTEINHEKGRKTLNMYSWNG